MISTYFADTRALPEWKRVYENTNGTDCGVFRSHLEARASPLPCALAIAVERQS